MSTAIAIRLTRFRAALGGQTYLFASAMVVVLLIANTVALPHFIEPRSWAGTIAAFAPFALAAMASSPSILSGGLDISVGPLISLLNIVFVVELVPHGLGNPLVSAPILLALGAAVGVANGVLVAVLRYPAIIATLCTFFVLDGLDLHLAPQPAAARLDWTEHLASGIGPVVLIGVPLLVWFALKRIPLVRTILAAGADPVAAYAAGVRVAAVRVTAYALGGLFAAVAAIALTALLRSADASLATQYTLIALAAVAFGGTPLTGGRGGLAGSVVGAAFIFLVQNLLNSLHLSALWLQVVYGGLLVAAVVLGAQLTSGPTVRKAV
jgi:ribose transport system permease protein